MSPLFLLCVLFLSCSVASRGGDFTLCKPLTLQRSAVILTFPQPTKIQHSLSFLHSLPCLNLCFNHKLLPIPCSTPTFKLAIILLLAGDVSLNPGPAVRRNIRLATTNVRSIRDKTVSLSDLLISKTIDILAVTETWLRPHDTVACIADISPSGYTFHHRPRSALNWFLSYLTGRHQTIKIANCFSAALPTSCGVPQDSVLGPLLFTLYTTPLSSVIQNHNLDHHLYADDTQIYISLATSDTNRSLNQLSDCL